MDQELKQRLIGAAVITALAAIFVPMLFDDPIDESGKSINELKIPELPSKAQDVEIMPLPEKVEDVATVPPVEKPQPPSANVVYEGEEEADMDMSSARPHATITEKETAVAPRTKLVEPEMNVVDEEEAVAPPEPVVAKPVKMPSQPVQTTEAPVKSTKPAIVEPTSKSSPPAVSATTRWYLNAGSFSQKSNALTMLDNLKKQGFAASIKEVAGEKGTVYKVRVGPMLDKAKAQEVKSKLAQINVTSFVSGDE